MTRFAIYTALAVTTLMMLGCGGASTPPPQPAAAPAASAAQLAAGNEKQNEILMAENGGHKDTSVTARCTASVPRFRIKAQRKQIVRWHIRDARFDPCPGLDPTMVRLEFDKAIWVDVANPSGPPVAVLNQNQGTNQIVGRVYLSATTVPNQTRASYTVVYQGNKASSDPDVDVDGDCSTCAP